MHPYTSVHTLYGINICLTHCAILPGKAGRTKRGGAYPARPPALASGSRCRYHYAPSHLPSIPFTPPPFSHRDPPTYPFLLERVVSLPS